MTAAFDIIGDVHGCHDELVSLLGQLGYEVRDDSATAPAGRTAVFLGDLVDRGPRVVAATRLAMNMVRDGAAHCILGNHERQMLRYLDGATEFAEWGLAETLEQLDAEPPAFIEELRAFAAALPWRLMLDGGKLLIAHAGLPEELQDQDTEDARWFALYGATLGDTVRADWASSYRGARTVVYGHTPTDRPVWINRTICIDTGCVYGGALTALRYPELELVSVPAVRVHYRGD